MKNIGQRLLARLEKTGMSPSQVAWSGALGIYLALSPFLGIQTLLIFVFAFLFRAHAGIIFTVLYTVNNPWTMIPIALFDYIVGAGFCTLFGFDFSPYDPTWMAWVNRKLGSWLLPYLGIKKLSFWTYFIGGNLVAIPAMLITYPALKKMYSAWIFRVKNGVERNRASSNNS